MCALARVYIQSAEPVGGLDSFLAEGRRVPRDTHRERGAQLISNQALYLLPSSFVKTKESDEGCLSFEGKKGARFDVVDDDKTRV